MKKLLFSVFCMLMLSSCSTDIGVTDMERFHKVDRSDNYRDAIALLYMNNDIYFYDITDNREQDSTVFTLYEQNIEDNRVHLAGMINGFYMTAGSPVLLEDGFAFTVCTKEEDELSNCLYCYTDGILSKGYSWDSNIPMSYISKISDEELALFYPSSEERGGEEFYIYKILRVNLADHAGEEIAQYQYNITRQEGEVVPAVDYSNGLFRIFRKTVQGPDSSYFVCSLDADGKKVAEYSIDLQDFLYLEPVSSYDSIYKMKCLDGRFFVLQTLNSRIILFEESDGRLMRLDAPGCLSAFPEGYKIAEYCGEHPGEVYFINMFQDNLIKFDAASRQFMELTIGKDNEESHIVSVHINPDGGILVNMDGAFYIYSRPKTFTNLHV